jgi:hypothetical protein
VTDRRPLIVVDAANVVGSVPDGWWRDRPRAATRLRDALVPVAREGLPGEPLEGGAEVVMVVEGAASGVQSIPQVRVVPATTSGDDTVVELVRTECANRDCVVITADRQLRSRVGALGARVAGPRSVWPRR